MYLLCNKLCGSHLANVQIKEDRREVNHSTKELLRAAKWITIIVLWGCLGYLLIDEISATFLWPIVACFMMLRLKSNLGMVDLGFISLTFIALWAGYALRHGFDAISVAIWCVEFSMAVYFGIRIIKGSSQVASEKCREHVNDGTDQ